MQFSKRGIHTLSKNAKDLISQQKGKIIFTSRANNFVSADWRAPTAAKRFYITSPKLQIRVQIPTFGSFSLLKAAQKRFCIFCIDLASNKGSWLFDILFLVAANGALHTYTSISNHLNMLLSQNLRLKINKLILCITIELKITN